MFIVPLFATYATNNRTVTVTVNGHQINFDDQSPVIINNRVLVPVRGVFEHMGYYVTWNSDSRVARIENDETLVIIPAEMESFVINRQILTPDVPQQIVGNRMLLPLRAVAEALGANAYWDDVNRVARIVTNQDNQEENQQPEAPPEPEQENPYEVERPTPVPPDEDNQDSDTYDYETESPNEYEPEEPPSTPTPETTPAPTVPPAFVPFPTLPPSQQQNTGQFDDITSQIQIPDRRLYEHELYEWIYEYHSNGGPNAFENRVMQLINDVREERDLNRLYINENLTMASRFYAQTLANLNLPLRHDVGPYGGAMATARLFGFNVPIWDGGIGNGGAWEPEVVVNRWMQSLSHREFILDENHIYIGFGSHLGGQWSIYHYLILSRRPS